jgi:nucleotide-binding universal stress UspA family protein
LEFDSLRLKDALVPVDGSEAAFDALALACSLTRKNKGTVYAVYVIEVARNLPLDADMAPDAQRGEDILTQAEKIANSLDARVEGEILQARDAGHAIVDEAIERGVNAIVLGVRYERPLGQFRLGDTADYVISHAHCQVVLVRAAVQE